MTRRHNRAEEVGFFNLPLAKWVVGVLGVLIGIAGKESLVGLTLRQTRSEIAGFVRDEEQPVIYPGDQWFNRN